jgi:chemotaxis protein MotB
VYKAADQDFLNRPALEIIGGDTTEALDTDKFSAASPPIVPIAPGLPLMTGGTVKKAESINLRDVDIDSAFSSVSDQTRIEKEVVEVPADRVIPPQPEPGVMTSPEKSESSPQQPPAMAATDTGPSLPIGVGRPDKIQEIYRLSKSALESNNLSSFAAVDLIVDNTMRIILTGDLLFDTGQAVMPQESRDKLEQVATAIQTTPYMINVIGHTDNVPMYSGRYSSNWELSVARASTVARFLIEEMGMNPNQFVVSGYASYRPMVSNATAENRKKNRRVEIIISKRLPNPVPADQQNLR